MLSGDGTRKITWNSLSSIVVSGSSTGVTLVAQSIAAKSKTGRIQRENLTGHTLSAN
jgi:hypothetical protein